MVTTVFFGLTLSCDQNVPSSLSLGLKVYSFGLSLWGLCLRPLLGKSCLSFEAGRC